MGNSSNKKVQKRKPPKKSKCQNSSDQKENVPKIEKNKANKPNPNDSIAKSKHLIAKKGSERSKRQSSTNHERVCANGKPIPSLAELEKMFEDSDEDDLTPKTPTQKRCTTPTPEKEIPTSISKKNLLSPSTISKITERVMQNCLIQNLPDPEELLEVVPLLPDIPPPPVIPPKKRKKPDVPYIVGCKDRPQVIRTPNTNFCKGDDDYGVDPSDQDPDEPPTKRAKKSKIPKYSKSIFNAQSDEIAERLTKEDAGGLSDASSDSNKTIEYDPTTLKNVRPHSFSPLPSTSKDNKTFIKNDELFNESLKEMNVTKEATPKKIEGEVTIIDNPYETIVIDDFVDSEKTVNIQNTSNTVDTKPVDLVVVMPKDDFEIHSIPNDDCIIVPSSPGSNNHKNSNETIVIDDEYSTINIDMNTFNNETIEIIDIDDVIAENKSILDKYKNNEPKNFNNINTVVNVPTTYRNSTTSQTTVTPGIIDNFDMTYENNSTNSLNNQSNNSLLTSHRQRSTELPTNRQTSITLQRSSMFQSILDNFFNHTATPQRNSIPANANDAEKNANVDIRRFFDAVVNRLQTPADVRNTISSQPVINTATPVLTHVFQNAENRQRDSVNLSQTSSIPGIQPSNTTLPLPSPTPSRNIGDCPICLEPLTSAGIASTICGHVFCLKCIQAAIKSNGKKCPTCRKALKGAGGGYHQLFL